MKILLYIFCIINLCFSFDLKNINTIKANFKQIVTSDGKKIEYDGILVATKGQNAYFEYTKPIKQKVFLNQGDLIVYTPNLNQAIIFKNDDVSIVNILNNAKQDGDKIISNINNITFFIFLDSNHIPTKIEYTDKLDNKNEIILSQVEINKDIDNDIFIFNAPDGTDIIYSKSSTFKR